MDSFHGQMPATSAFGHGCAKQTRHDVRREVAHEFRHEREVIVLNEQQSIRARLLDRRARERLVHRLIRGPVGGTECRLRVRDVAERPDSFVREPRVVALVPLFFDPEPAQRVFGCVRRDGDSSCAIRGDSVRRTAAMSDPRSSARAQDRLDAGHETAGWLPNDDLAAVFELVRVGLAIGDDHQPAAGDPGADQLAKALGSVDHCCAKRHSIVTQRFAPYGRGDAVYIRSMGERTDGAATAASPLCRMGRASGSN
jgi:hypothetical protein